MLWRASFRGLNGDKSQRGVNLRAKPVGNGGHVDEELSLGGASGGLLIAALLFEAFQLGESIRNFRLVEEAVYDENAGGRTADVERLFRLVCGRRWEVVAPTGCRAECKPQVLVGRRSRV